MRNITFLSILSISLLLFSCATRGSMETGLELTKGSIQAEPIPQPLVVYPAPLDSSVFAEGLNSPRQMAVGEDGTVYIAEAGVAGNNPQQVSEEATVMSGLSSRISAVDTDGRRRIVIPGLPSIQTRPNNTGFRGAQAVAISPQTIWIAMGETVAPSVQLMPFFVTVLGVERGTLRLVHMADTLGAQMNSAGDRQNAVSDPVDLVLAADGTLYIADAGANTLWQWTSTVGLQRFHTWPSDDNPVPTTVALGPDDDLYIGFLSGAPFDKGSARIERWTREGSLVETYEGLTLVTDVLIAEDGSLFAVEMGQGGGGEGSPFAPETGRVVHVDQAGIEAVATGLTAPYGLAWGPDGSLLVSVGSAFSAEPGVGKILKIEIDR